jgi:hypothetical protein
VSQVEERGWPLSKNGTVYEQRCPDPYRTAGLRRCVPPMRFIQTRSRNLGGQHKHARTFTEIRWGEHKMEDRVETESGGGTPRRCHARWGTSGKVVGLKKRPPPTEAFASICLLALGRAILSPHCSV